MWRRQFPLNRNASQTFGPGATGYGNPNLFTKTADFSGWSQQAVTTTTDTTVGPDGTTTADTLTDSAASAFHGVFQTIGLPASGTNAVSVFAKQGTCRYLTILFGNTGGYAFFDLQGGVVGGTSLAASISAAANGFFRCCLLGASNTNPDSCYFLLNPAGATGTPSYAGGTGTLFLWGAQAQIGSLGPYHPVP